MINTLFLSVSPPPPPRLPAGLSVLEERERFTFKFVSLLPSTLLTLEQSLSKGLRKDCV